MSMPNCTASTARGCPRISVRGWRSSVVLKVNCEGSQRLQSSSARNSRAGIGSTPTRVLARDMVPLNLFSQILSLLIQIQHTYDAGHSMVKKNYECLAA